jgi:hypothetical protein
MSQPKNEIEARDYVLSIGRDIAEKKLDRISQRGTRKIEAYQAKNPSNVWYGETSFDFLSDAEKTFMHKLKIGLMLTNTSKEDARSRIIARRAERKAQRTENKVAA